MKLSRNLSLMMIICILFLSGCARDTGSSVQKPLEPKQNLTVKTVNESLSIEEVQEDFEYLWQLLSENYPFFEVNKRLNGVDFLNNKEKYWASVKQAKTKDELYFAISNMLLDLNNSHVNLFSRDNQSAVRNYFYGVTKLSTADGNAYKKYYDVVLEPFKAEKSIEYYGELPENPDLGVPDSLKINGMENNRSVLVSSFKDNKILYVRVDSFSTVFLERDYPYIYDFISNHKEAEALIIDIRNNGGGNPGYWGRVFVEPIIDKPISRTNYLLFKQGEYNMKYINALKSVYYETLFPISTLDKNNFKNAKEEVFRDFETFYREEDGYLPTNSYGFKGKVYLLIGPTVFSASEKFASFSKETGFATLVGQKTGGDGITRTPLYFVLPNSGILGRYPYIYGMNSRGEANEEVKTEPDYLVEDISQPTDLNKDSCILKVLELENERKK